MTSSTLVAGEGKTGSRCDGRPLHASILLSSKQALITLPLGCLHGSAEASPRLGRKN